MRVNTHTVARDVGRILQMVSLMLVISLLIGVLNGEFYTIPAFLLSAGIVAGIGTILAQRYQDANPPGKLEAMVTAASGWAATGVLGGLPFILIAATIQIDPFPVWANTPQMNDTVAVFLNPLDAVFESMSGYSPRRRPPGAVRTVRCR